LTTLLSIRDHNGRVSRSEIWYMILGIVIALYREGFKDIFEVTTKSDLPCLVVVLKEVLKILGITSVLN